MFEPLGQAGHLNVENLVAALLEFVFTLGTNGCASMRRSGLRPEIESNSNEPRIPCGNLTMHRVATNVVARTPIGP